MDRDRRNMQFSSQCSLIQRLDVFEPMLEPITAEVDFALRDRIKHEGIVRVR